MSDNPGYPWKDCGNVQCKQLHETLNSILETLGIECDDSVFVVGKAVHISQGISKLMELNEDKFTTINAYCRMASMDKWKIDVLVRAIDEFLSASGCSEHSKILTHARAEVVNSKTGLI